MKFEICSEVIMKFLTGLRYTFHHQSIFKAIPLKIRKCFYLNVSKDVNIYKYDNARFARLLTICASGQWFVMTHMSVVMFQHMPAFFSWIPLDEPSDKQDTMSKDNQRIPCAKWTYRLAFSLFTFGISCAVLAGSCIYCARTVQSITLLKSSDKVLFKTYTPIGTLQNTIVPVAHVSALQSRTASMGYVPLRVKDYHFNFIVDKSGHFSQPSLFERTVGIKRDFGKKSK